ncbi:hypothetical protein BGX28_001750, partial [Mortierella sp. GBA30]
MEQKIAALLRRNEYKKPRKRSREELQETEYRNLRSGLLSAKTLKDGILPKAVNIVFGARVEPTVSNKAAIQPRDPKRRLEIWHDIVRSSAFHRIWFDIWGTDHDIPALDEPFPGHVPQQDYLHILLSVHAQNDDGDSSDVQESSDSRLVEESDDDKEEKAVSPDGSSNGDDEEAVAESEEAEHESKKALRTCTVSFNNVLRPELHSRRDVVLPKIEAAQATVTAVIKEIYCATHMASLAIAAGCLHTPQDGQRPDAVLDLRLLLPCGWWDSIGENSIVDVAPVTVGFQECIEQTAAREIEDDRYK